MPGSPATARALSAPPTACAAKSAAMRSIEAKVMYPPRMQSITRVRPLILLASALAALVFVEAPAAQAPQRPPTYPALPSETPTRFEPVTSTFDYVKRDVMIPMRDGV